MDCRRCGEEADEWVTLTLDGKRQRVCEACAEDVAADAEIEDSAQSAMQGMMEYKGR